MEFKFLFNYSFNFFLMFLIIRFILGIFHKDTY